MARFRLDSIASLARQMSFTPLHVRASQIAAAEELLHTLDPNRAYPLDFVIFRITGYHPRNVTADLLTGLALQHDLGLLIETVSETLDLKTSAFGEPVLSIDDVTEKFNVTSKTIQRWRRKGLPARRFIFPDGKRRVGFLLASVERYFTAHREQVARAGNFSQIDAPEREQILRRARRLAHQCNCCAQEISRRIARKLNRSPLTILHTIKKHDQEHPAQAIFPSAGRPLTDEERARIGRLYRKNVPIRKLARRFCRSRHAVYRAIMEERIARINRRKLKFIDDPIYHGDDADVMLGQLLAQEELGRIAPSEESRIPRDLPPYLQDLYRTPLLTPSQERALFLKYNYHKYQFVTARRKLDPQFARSRDLDVLENYLLKATQTKNRIVAANLRLVVNIAKRHLKPGLNLMELISDGNIVLMRAVESFDIHKGNRFSTYATLALMKGFARSVPQLAASRQAVPVEQAVLERVPDHGVDAELRRLMDRDEVQRLMQRLNRRERDVLMAHYGVGDAAPATYEQVARRLGLPKQRVRRIEQAALDKLRAGLHSA